MLLFNRHLNSLSVNPMYWHSNGLTLSYPFDR